MFSEIFDIELNPFVKVARFQKKFSNLYKDIPVIPSSRDVQFDSDYMQDVYGCELTLVANVPKDFVEDDLVTIDGSKYRIKLLRKDDSGLTYVGLGRYNE